jgi:hypothetical protein
MTWGNTDAKAQKPKWDVERQVREVVQLTTANTTLLGNNVVTFAYNDGAGNNVANVGVATNQYVFVLYNGLGGNSPGANGYPGFFSGNVTVSSINGNNVVLSQNVLNSLSPNTIVEFDKAIVYNTNKPVIQTYNSDTVLVTPTRLTSQNNLINGNMVQGWVHVQKKTNADGTVRYIRETLVALANPVASNTSSGNTSWGQAFANT